MEIQISIQEPQQIVALLNFLKSIQLDTYKVLENAVSSNKMLKKEVSLFDQFYGSVPELNVTECETYLKKSRNEWERPPLQQSRFDKYNGVWKNKLSVDEIDERLNTLRINF